MQKIAHSWFALKKVLAEKGILIETPLFHGTDLEVLPSIRSSGIKPLGHGDAGLKNSVCFSRSLDFYTEGNTALDWVWDKQSVILVLDFKEVSARLHSRPYNWHYEKLKAKDLYDVKNKSLHEFETRFTSDTELIIPAKYIKACIVKKSIDTGFPTVVYTHGAYLWEDTDIDSLMLKCIKEYDVLGFATLVKKYRPSSIVILEVIKKDLSEFFKILLKRVDYHTLVNNALHLKAKNCLSLLDLKDFLDDLLHYDIWDLAEKYLSKTMPNYIYNILAKKYLDPSILPKIDVQRLYRASIFVGNARNLELAIENGAKVLAPDLEKEVVKGSELADVLLPHVWLNTQEWNDLADKNPEEVKRLLPKIPDIETHLFFAEQMGLTNFLKLNGR